MSTDSEHNLNGLYQRKLPQKMKKNEVREIAKVFDLRCDAIRLCRHVDVQTPDSQNKRPSPRVLCLDPAKNRVELLFRVYLNVDNKMRTKNYYFYAEKFLNF